MTTTPGASAPLTIDTAVIHQHDGLYSLNDLHRASGGEAKHQPRYFFANEQTKKLAEKLKTENSGIPLFETRRGVHGGTYACRELVIAYAAWISPAFHLIVLRVFLAHVVQPEARPALPAVSDIPVPAEMAGFRGNQARAARPHAHHSRLRRTARQGWKSHRLAAGTRRSRSSVAESR
ncbi:MAG: KilA-N domain-containing protein [Azoarcus sp.]|nr:KilA-N domain-containing protein [Azoarcus sp.]